MQIIKASEIPKVPSMLLYGDNRTGKTYLLSTASQVPFLCPTLIIDADGGAVTAQQTDPNQDIAVFDPKKPFISQLPEALKKAKDGNFKFIAVDTLSYLMHRCLMEISGWQKPGWPHYTALFSLIHKWVIELKAITPYLCCTCFVKHDKNDEGTIMSSFPQIVGQDFPRVLASEFNILGFMSMKTTKTGKDEKTEYTLKTRQAGKECTGDRLTILGDLTNPTMQTVFEKIGFKL